MAASAANKPDKCPNPNCGSQAGFKLRENRFQYETRTQIGTLDVQQILRKRITTWECDACHRLIEIEQNL